MADLALATLDRIGSERRPLVDPRALRPRIVHFGLGAFHRAHQAVYTEAAAAASGEPWGIAAVAPRSAVTVATLRSQDCLYSVTDSTTRVVGSLVEALRMGPDSARMKALLASPDVTVVTVTITEKAYYRRPGTDALDTTEPAIAGDLAATASPASSFKTVVGALTGALADRFRRGGPPISVVSCDNMAGNGRILARVVDDFAASSAWRYRERLRAWLAQSVTFPSTVVDRIVPATQPEHLHAVASSLGLFDFAPVFGEPHRQWVLEDSFAADVPAWDRDGAEFVEDVAPYQLQKLRLLNGTHSALAYLGSAAGLQTVADVLETDWGERFVRAFGAEAGMTLAGDPAPYVDQLVERFHNPAIRHRLSQIGSDGSLKLPERWFGTLRELQANGKSAPLLELSLAAWARTTEADRGSGMTDPLAAQLAGCWTGAASDVEAVRRLLRLTGGHDLAEQDALTTSIARHLPALRAGRIEI